jgi:hypothetical protein
MKSEDIDTAQGWFATNITPDRHNNRIGITFFFHKEPLYEAWDLVGGDQFFYIDQRPGKERAGWTLYSVVAQAPEEAAGVSMRARFTSFPKGKVWYDDFMIEELEVEPNVLVNPGLEDTAPNFFEMLNDGMEGAECLRASDTAWTGGDYSFKVVKPAATTDPVGWKSANNADLYWNNASDGTFTLSFYAKTEGVNTEPADDDASIGVLYEFYAEGSLIGEKFVKIDQSVATADFTQVQDVLLLASAPDEVYATAHMGKDATGTVWFDNISCGSDPWSMGVFNGGAEIPDGWMNWSSGEGTQFCNVVADTAHTGDHSVLLHEEDDSDDEMVFYSEPAPAEAGKWYMVSVWMKSEGVNTHDGWFATNITPDRDNDRIGITFFFHKEPLYEAWDLVGGDQFFYIDQRTGKEREDWTLYKVIAQAPEEAAGASMRARFTSFPTGSVWYDDFSIQEVSMVVTAIENPTNQLAIMPAEYELFNNYPNPFNPETIIEYKVPNTGKVKLAIYNVLGQNVKTLVDMNQPAGTYTVMWDGTDNNGSKLASGVYFYQLIGENALITKKMTLIK